MTFFATLTFKNGGHFENLKNTKSSCFNILEAISSHKSILFMTTLRIFSLRPLCNMCTHSLHTPLFNDVIVSEMQQVWMSVFDILFITLCRWHFKCKTFICNLFLHWPKFDISLPVYYQGDQIRPYLLFSKHSYITSGFGGHIGFLKKTVILWIFWHKLNRICLFSHWEDQMEYH